MNAIERSRGLRRERMLNSARFHDGRFHNTEAGVKVDRAHSKLSTTSEYLFGGSTDRRP